MKRIFLILVFLLTTVDAHATRYWASPTGGAANCAAASGSADPGQYRTLTQAISCANASGDEVYITPGTYTSNATITNPTSGVTIRGSSATFASWPVLSPTATANPIDINTTSTARSNITFQYIKVNQSANSVASSCFRNSGSGALTNIVLQDFLCTGTNLNANSSAGINFGPEHTNAIIRRVTSHGWQDTDPLGAHGFYIRGHGHIVEHCTAYDNSGYGIQLSNSTQGAAGISNITTRYCVIYDNGSDTAGNGGMVVNSANTGIVVHNNLIINNAKHGLNLTASNVKVYNNTIVGNTLTGIIRSGSGHEITNNIVHSNGTNTSGSGGTLTTNIVGTGNLTDIFIDAAGGNYSLKESSAAIDAGTVISGFSAGRYVGSNPDQGALESCIRSSAVVEDATDTTYSITFSCPTQSARNNITLQTPTLANIAIREDTGGGAAGKTETSVTVNVQTRLDVVVTAAFSAGTVIDDAYTRSTAPSLMDNVAIGDPNGSLGTNYHNAYVRTYSPTLGTNNIAGPPPATFTQTRYRFHFLNGTEASPTVHAAENTSITLPRGAALRLRVKFRTDDNPDAITFKLRYSKDGGSYTDLPDMVSTDLISWYGTTGASDIPEPGSATTELLTSDESTNVACAVIRSSSDYPLLDFNNGETECEYIIQISNSVSIGTTYDFRVYKSDNVALDTYTVTPRLTIGSYVGGSGM